MTQKPVSYCLYFDLSWSQNFDYFAPTIYIHNHQNAKYLEKKASDEVLKGYGIEKNELPETHQKLFAICKDLKPENIFKTFEKKSKSKKTFADLWNDAKIGTLVKNYVDRKTIAFIEIIAANNLPFSLNINKDKDFSESKITISNKKLQTLLQFDKKPDGLSYSLMLLLDEKPFHLTNHKVTLLTNFPCYITIENELFLLNELEGKKLKPFLAKKTIEVPEKTISQFFEKFVKDIVKKTNIEATGFEVVVKNKIINTKIVLVEDFFSKQFKLDLVFDYEQFKFKNTNPKSTHSFINDKGNNEISVTKFERDFEAEQKIEKKLTDFGFVKNHLNLFCLEGEQDSLKTVDFIIQNKKAILEKGFLIDELLVYGKKITNEIGIINLESTEKADWFDLKIDIKCGEFVIKFSQIINNIKTNNRFFELPNGTFFLIPFEWLTKYSTLANFVKINNHELKLPKSNHSLLQNLEIASKSNATTNNLVYKPPTLLKATLRPYQLQGTKWLLNHYNNKLGACLADDMGLGKTLQTLALLVSVQENLIVTNNDQPLDLFSAVAAQKEPLKALIVLPASLVFNWFDEAKKFAPHLSKIKYIGNDRKNLVQKIHHYDLIFTTYNLVSKDIDLFKKHQFRYLILDESQQIKNRNSQIFKSINTISAENKVSLSGTPIENSLNDLWSQMQFINPDILGTYPFFNNYFKIPIEKNKNEDRIAELKSIINPFVLRRTKTEVLTDLPSIIEQIVFCDMTQKQQSWYESEKSLVRNELLKIENVNQNKILILSALMRLRQLCNHPKLIDKTSEIESGKFETVTNYIETILKSNGKILVFSMFTAQIEIYENWCTQNKIDFCTITGNVPVKNRGSIVKTFQKTSVPIFFISLKAGGVGLNLTKASYVLLLDPWWNPFAELQAIGRAHRIGQENKVHVTRFVTKNSIEEKIITLQQHKKKIAETIIDIEAMPASIASNLDELLS
jgi:SNF2 family DNA or RNA helicase